MRKLINMANKLKTRGFRGAVVGFSRRLERTYASAWMPIELRQYLWRARTALRSLDMDEARRKTLDYVETLRISGGRYGVYKYSSNQVYPVLYASAYAALTRHLYRDLSDLTSNERGEWLTYLKSFQMDDGVFRDPAIACDLAKKCNWWGWNHLTIHVLMAIAALGGTADKKLQQIAQFRRRQWVREWLGSRDWVLDPADSSNEVQNALTLVQYSRDFHEEAWAKEAMRDALDWLRGVQDASTGLWGSSFSSAHSLSQGVQAAYHLLLLYFYDNVEIQYSDRIVDSCIATQNSLGGYGISLNSTACEDIDTIDPLARLYSVSEYRRDDIRASIASAAPWVMANMNLDGGFVFQRMTPFVYCHKLMTSNRNESSLFATWFRTVSLAFMGQVLKESPIGKYEWAFLECPGHQFLRR